MEFDRRSRLRFVMILLIPTGNHFISLRLLSIGYEVDFRHISFIYNTDYYRNDITINQIEIKMKSQSSKTFVKSRSHSEVCNNEVRKQQ